MCCRARSRALVACTCSSSLTEFQRKTLCMLTAFSTHLPPSDITWYPCSTMMQRHLYLIDQLPHNIFQK